MIGGVFAGRYRIIAKIGSGGAGEVFEAEDLELPRKVAIKLLVPIWGDDHNLRQRFLREAEALSSLDHPHICTIYESGETEDGRLFIAMAYYPGENLRVLLARGEMPVSETVACAISVADGMDKAHRMGFLHRDLKPGNIVITEDGVVKILDFGLAKLPDRTQMTETGVAMGTLAYASPEQLRGEKLDVRADIYSLGVVLYQMASGVCPFTAPTAAATLQMVLNEDPAELRTLRDDLPPALELLIGRCMSKERDQRPSSMAEVRDELVEVLSEISPTLAARRRAEYVEADTVVRHRRRRRIGIPVVIVIALALLAIRSEPVREFFGFGSAKNNHGIVVLSLQVEGQGAELGPLTRGLWLDLTDQTTRLAELSRNLWVLPPHLLRSVTAEAVADRFGVSAMIDGFVRIEDEHLVLDLHLKDARTLDILESGSWSIPGDSSVAPDFLGWLSSALNIPINDRSLVDAEHPNDLVAFRSYLFGLAALEDDVDEALGEFDAALVRVPEFAAARIARADALVGRGDLDDAEALLSTEPRHPALLSQNYVFLSRIASARDDLAGAVRLMRSAVTRSPRNPDYRRKLGAALSAQDAVESEERVFVDAIHANPRYFGAWEDLGYFYLRHGRYDESIEHYRKITELAPTYDQPYNTLGACHYALEQWTEATAMFEKSFALRENYAACSNLGLLYYMDREYEDAARMFEWGREYDKSNHILIGNLAASLRWLPGREDEVPGLLIEAIALAEQDLESTPDDGETLAYLAGYLVTDHPDQAVPIAERALQVAPDDGAVAYRTAVVYEEAGQRTRALTLLGGAIDQGYPVREINSERLLDDLRDDPRYRLLLP